MVTSVKKRSLSLRTRILLIFASASIITLAFISVGIFLFVNRTERESWLTRQQESARATSYQIRAFIDQVQKSQSLLSFLQTTMDDDVYQRLLSLMLLLGRNMDEIVVTGEDGSVLFSVARNEPVLISRITGGGSNEEEETGEDWFEATSGLSQGQFFLGELELDNEGSPYLVISSPNRVGGVIAFRINAQVISDLIQDLKFGETGNAYLVEGEGPIIAHTDFSVVLNRTSLAGRPELIEVPDQDSIGNLLEVEDDNPILIGIEYTNFKGQTVLGVQKVIPGTDGIIFIEVSQVEAFATSRNAIILLGGFSIISWGFSMFGFSRLLSDLVFKPLTNLQSGQVAIEQGNLGHQIAILHNDELGQVTTGFNLMSKQLDERNRQRIEQEKALRASEADNRILIENSPTLIVKLDMGKRLSFVRVPRINDELLKPLIGLDINTFLPDDAYKESTLAEINKIYSHKKTVSYESFASDPDGNMAWYLINGAPILDGDKVVGAILMGVDISESKKANQIIKQRDAILSAVSFGSERLLKNNDWQSVINEVLAKLGEAAQASRIYIFQNQHPTPTGDILIDQKYEWVAEGVTPEIDNPDLQNLSLDEVLPRWKTTLGNREIISGFVKDFPQSERDILEPQNIVSILVLPIFVNDEWWGFIGFDECTGERVWQPLEIEALRTASNNIGATIQRQEAESVVQSQNDTLIKANRELAISRRQAEAANKLKSQFLATMSHELRTPLNAVIGYSQLQLAGMAGQLSDEQKTFQERILINAQHLLQLINEVLDISKIEAGRMDLSQKPISLRGVFDEIIAQNRVLAESKGLSFTLNYDDRLPEIIIGDRGRIKQIVINLISNAIKFTDKGEVKIDVILHNKDAWRVIVTDSGIGIAPHEQETIFDEFRQAENGLERGGTGLGLAIVRKLIAMMGGTIRVNSELGVGSSFTITLPIITEDEIKEILAEE